MKSFIATQHPLSNTMRDFWSMIWQQDVEVVVMVNDGEKDLVCFMKYQNTNTTTISTLSSFTFNVLFPHSQENFHNYWMNQKNALTIYGNMQVKTDSMESMGAFDITSFVLKNSQV